MKRTGLRRLTPGLKPSETWGEFCHLFAPLTVLFKTCKVGGLTELLERTRL